MMTHVTAPTQFVETNGIRFAYRRFGRDSGVPLLFMQHFRGGMDHWDPAVTDGFGKDRPVILFDNAGVASSSGETPDKFLRRHVTGDYGELCEDDRLLNEQAVLHGDRILSAYMLANGVKIWIITEATGGEPTQDPKVMQHSRVIARSKTSCTCSLLPRRAARPPAGPSGNGVTFARTMSIHPAPHRRWRPRSPRLPNGGKCEEQVNTDLLAFFKAEESSVSASAGIRHE